MARKPIVAGTDGSPRSQTAVNWAVKEAARRELPLLIVSVASFGMDAEWLSAPEASHGQTRGMAVRALEDAASEVSLIDPLLTVDTRLRIGEAGPTLASLDRDASMIVIGGPGRDGPAASHDSVARYLAGRAHCPVVVGCGDTGRDGHQIVVGLHDLSSYGPAWRAPSTRQPSAMRGCSPCTPGTGLRYSVGTARRSPPPGCRRTPCPGSITC